MAATIEAFYWQGKKWLGRFPGNDWSQLPNHLGAGATDAELLAAGRLRFGYLETAGASLVRLPPADRLPKDSEGAQHPCSKPPQRRAEPIDAMNRTAPVPVAEHDAAKWDEDVWP